MITVTRRFTFSAAHRLTHGYKGICNSLHGHNYTLLVTLVKQLGESVLNDLDMVMDFKVLDQLVGKIIQEVDHAVLIGNDDRSLLRFLKKENQRYVQLRANTTAEQIALWFWDEIYRALEACGSKCRVVRITVQETEGSTAEVNNEDI